MVEKLQPIDKEKVFLHSPNVIEERNLTAPTTPRRTPMLDSDYYIYYQELNGEKICKLMDEVLATVKDDRINTKRSILADIASTAKVQNQSKQIIEACDHELQRSDLTQKQRDGIFECMTSAAATAVRVNEASRTFQREQLDLSHKLPLKVLGCVAALLLGGVAGIIFIRAKTFPY